MHNLDCETAIDPLTAAGGESGTTPALAVIIGAIVDALSAYGIRDITMPATPFPVWQAIADAEARKSIGGIAQLHGRGIAATRLSLTQTS